MRQTLVILTPGFPKDENDTTCLPAQQLLVKALHKNYPGLDIRIFSFQYPYAKKVYSWNDIEITAFGGKRRGHIFRRILWLKVYRKLSQLHKKRKISFLLSFWLDECAFVANKFSKKNQLKHFIWLLGQDAKAGNRYFTKIKPGSDQLISISDFITELIAKTYAIRPEHILPAFVDPDLFLPDALQRTVDIIGVGSLIPLKRFDVFIEIVSKLKNQFPNIRAVICGKGSEQRQLELQINSLGLTENVQLSGELSHQEVLVLMQQSKILLHPSSYEGFAAVTVEALYAGAHVISFCRALNTDIDQWHISKTENEMYTMITSILVNKHQRFDSIMLFSAKEAANKLMQILEN